MPDFKDIDSVIFDLDGTLLDTVDDLSDSVNFAFRELGYSAKTKDEVRFAVGSGVSALFEKLLPGGLKNPDIVFCIEKFKEFYINIEKSKTRPYDNILELLAELKKRGYKTGIVSNKFDRGTKLSCKTFFDGLIDFAQGEDELNGIIRKPNPAGLYRVIEKLGAKKILYVGDSEVDIKTAQNAGVPCVSVLWGLKSEEFLKAHGGKIFVKNPLEILDML